MEQKAEIGFVDFEDILDRDFGVVGTPKRDEFERSVDDAANTYRVGEAIRAARLQQNLTQEQLGERMGVKKAQISKLESGKSITFASLIRVFRAMNVHTAHDMQGIGRVALW